MGMLLGKGKYQVCFVIIEVDICVVQRLWYLCFVEMIGGLGCVGGVDVDVFDVWCEYIFVEDSKINVLVCCFCLMLFSGGCEIGNSYLVQYYELFVL